MEEIEKEYKKLFGNMYLSESETALRIFELGYKAGYKAAVKVEKMHTLADYIKKIEDPK